MSLRTALQVVHQKGGSNKIFKFHFFIIQTFLIRIKFLIAFLLYVLLILLCISKFVLNLIYQINHKLIMFINILKLKNYLKIKESEYQISNIYTYKFYFTKLKNYFRIKKLFDC